MNTLELVDSEIPQLLSELGVLPVVTVSDTECAEPMARALKIAGLPVIEVTLRTAAAPEVLRRLAADPELLVGAGTVIRPDQVDLAHAAGARFVLTPGFSERVVERCWELGIAAIPGVCTASDLIAALDHGCELVKFFPAHASGGVVTLRALHGPFPQVRFIPTGGVSAANAAEYLSLPFVAAVGGSWMVPPQLNSHADFAVLSRLAGQAVALAAQVRA